MRVAITAFLLLVEDQCSCSVASTASVDLRDSREYLRSSPLR